MVPKPSQRRVIEPLTDRHEPLIDPAQSTIPRRGIAGEQDRQRECEGNPAPPRRSPETDRAPQDQPQPIDQGIKSNTR